MHGCKHWLSIVRLFRLYYPPQEWDESLASMAQAWSDTCHWGHGQPEPNTSPFTGHIGQNMYVIYPGVPEARPNASLVTVAWYNEVAFYSYDANGCEAGEICGHYTQVRKPPYGGPEGTHYFF